MCIADRVVDVYEQRRARGEQLRQREGVGVRAGGPSGNGGRRQAQQVHEAGAERAEPRASLGALLEIHQQQREARVAHRRLRQQSGRPRRRAQTPAARDQRDRI